MAGPSNNEQASDVALIRRVLARELETINEYEASARSASSPEVAAFFLHLAAEEKEHVAEAVHMLRLLDAGQEAHFSKPVVLEHFQGAVGQPSPASPGTQAKAPAPRGPPAAPARNGATEPLAPLPPQHAIYSVPAAPSAGALPLTVGSLRRTR
jgi:rubrerythrin